VGDEVDAQRSELFQGHHQLFHAAGKPVKPPHDHNIERAAVGVFHKSTETWPPFLCTA
jgi:hypothetical protein